MRWLKYIIARYFCRHDWEEMEHPRHYFHAKCTKCKLEKWKIGGM